ncbi:MAG TPA: anhydro-N-acetylmuramic acid kinase, partial [Burkholderiaceae bacterium]|nr:anhydro-N-acetylmuramic acid kinase [Burkholderiaceae bacterium]
MTARSALDTSLFIGLMSGTSLDGVDAVLADCSTLPPRTVAHAYLTFSHDLRLALAALCTSGPDEIERAGVVARELAHVYAASVDDLLKTAGVARGSVRAIGAHGQTVRHRPELGFSVQLNAPAWLAELTGIDVVADFRSRDIAAGGHGAPLASIFHVAAFSGPEPRAVINIGGISNLTGLPGAGAADRRVIGFDCGPGNLLLDFWMQHHFGAPFDRDGAVAASAEPDPRLLDTLLAEPFFTEPPPKSTGRELFSPAWVARAIGESQVND